MKKRKIKFRFWCPAGKAFIKDYKYNGLVDELFDEKEYDLLIPQQFTGLKDKNGKDIYEGDIIKATSDQYENENFVGKVIFDEGSYLTWINKNDIRGINEDDFEVIGNIFDNPELLKL